MEAKCPRCGSELRQEARNWGSVVKCTAPGCKFIKVGTISDFARGQMHQPRVGRDVYDKADSMAGAVQAAGSWHETPVPPVRHTNPDADAAAEEADIENWD